MNSIDKEKILLEGESAFKDGIALSGNAYNGTDEEMSDLWGIGWKHAANAHQASQDTIQKHAELQESRQEGVLRYNEPVFQLNLDHMSKSAARIVDHLLSAMFVLTIACLFIVAIAWLFGKVAPWPISAVIIILLLLFRFLNNK
jgi:uncharacterized membrane protein YdbT with pleckstrin-like domain